MVLGFYGKRKDYDVKCISLGSDLISKFLTVGLIRTEWQTMCLNFMTIQRLISSRSSFLLRQWDKFGGLQEKEKVMREEERKNKLRGWTIIKATVWPNISLFIPRYSQPIIYSIYLFLLFYKNQLYFIHIKWVNKILFLWKMGCYTYTIFLLLPVTNIFSFSWKKTICNHFTFY